MIPLTLTQAMVAAEPDESISKKMLPIYVREVETYSIAIESAPDKPVKLKKEPVFEWLNPARKTQQGAIFLWLRDGRPAALACIFSAPRPQWKGRQIMHELHALDPEKLLVTRKELHQWKPEAGLVRKEIPDAPAPVATPGSRLVQMRRLAREFTGHSVDRDGNEWQLRLLPNPLYRYPTAKTGVIDGALFAMMSNAGTDPEVLLVIEAVEANGVPRWAYACGRFSDWSLHVRHKGAEVFTYERSKGTQSDQPDPQLYCFLVEKVVTPEGKVIARVRQTPRGPQLVPVEDK